MSQQKTQADFKLVFFNTQTVFLFCMERNDQSLLALAHCGVEICTLPLHNAPDQISSKLRECLKLLSCQYLD